MSGGGCVMAVRYKEDEDRGPAGRRSSRDLLVYIVGVKYSNKYFGLLPDTLIADTSICYLCQFDYTLPNN